MTASELIELRSRTPFEPLEIHLSNGGIVRVEKPYQIATRHDSPTCAVFENEEQMRIIAFRDIQEVVAALNGH